MSHHAKKEARLARFKAKEDPLHREFIRFGGHAWLHLVAAGFA